MASGHVNRAEGSNTWPHRTNAAFLNKTLARLGTVHTRPFSTFALTQQFVCNWGKPDSSSTALIGRDRHKMPRLKRAFRDFSHSPPPQAGAS